MRLRSQLNALVEKKVLASYTGGVTGKYLFGKAVGIYFLDTEEVAKALNLPVDILPFDRMESGSIAPERGRYMVQHLYTLARLLSGVKIDDSNKTVKGEGRYQQKFWDYEQEEFSKFVPLFSDTEQTRVVDYLQTKLEQYVSFYLTVESESVEGKKQVELAELKLEFWAQSELIGRWCDDSMERKHNLELLMVKHLTCILYSYTVLEAVKCE
ncbi:TPA: hypothetical protein ACX6QX_002790 [Photobacterium damselae]